MNTTRIIIAFIALAFCSISHADMRDYSAQERADAMTEWMTEKLDLEDSTVEAAAALNLKYANKVDEIIQNTKSRISIMKQVKSSMKEKEKELEQLFGEETYSRYNSLKSSMKKDIESKLKGRAK